MATLSNLVIGGSSLITITNLPLTILKFELDMADVAALGTFSTGDGIKLLDAPADTYFELVQAEVVTALAGITRVDVGDSQDDDEFITNQTTVSAGTNMTLTKETFTNGKVLSAADDFIVKLTGTPSTGIIRFVALVGDATRVLPAATPTYTHT